MLRESDLAQSLAAGWTLARDVTLASGSRVAAHADDADRAADTRVPQAARAGSRGAASEPRSADHAQPRAASATPPTCEWRDGATRHGVPLLITRRNDVRRRADRAATAPRPPPWRPRWRWRSARRSRTRSFPTRRRALMEGARAWLDKGERRDDDCAIRRRERQRARISRTAATNRSPPETRCRPTSRPPNVAAAEAPLPAASSPTPACGRGACRPPRRKNAPTIRQTAGNAESGDAVASSPKPKAGSSAAAADFEDESASSAARRTKRRARRGKRAATKSAPLPLGASRPRTRDDAQRAPASRYAMSTPRASPRSSARNPGAGSAAAVAGRRARRDGARRRCNSSSSFRHPSHAAHANVAAAGAAAGGNVPPSEPRWRFRRRSRRPRRSRRRAAPKSSTATRRARAARLTTSGAQESMRCRSSSDFTKRKAAPIEERSFQEVTPSAEAFARAASGDRRFRIAPCRRFPRSTCSRSSGASRHVVDSEDRRPAADRHRASARARRHRHRRSRARADSAPDRARENDLRAARRGAALAQSVPRIAVQTQAEIAPVLWAAAKAQDPRAEREVVDSAQAIWVRDGATAYSQPIEPAAARRLNDEAMQAYWVRRNIPEAFDLSLKAFGANPERSGSRRQPRVPASAGSIPSQPETARQLALHAIAVRGSRFRTRTARGLEYLCARERADRARCRRAKRDVRHRGARGKRRAQLQGRAERDRQLRRTRARAGRGDAVSHPHARTGLRIAVLRVAPELGDRHAPSMRTPSTAPPASPAPARAPPKCVGARQVRVTRDTRVRRSVTDRSAVRAGLDMAGELAKEAGVGARLDHEVVPAIARLQRPLRAEGLRRPPPPAATSRRCTGR